MSLHGTLLFHLNLNYSAIEVAERREVVRRCYRPLLELAERLPWISFAIEASGHTLERMSTLDADWLERLRTLVGEGRVELVGSGDSQVIGPLVPASVNRWNQRLGQETYERLIGRRPETALVNELAWSQGIVDAYLDAGYETLVMEWNNPRRHSPDWENEWRYGRVWTRSPDTKDESGRRISLLWVDAVAFQKFQRAVVGDLGAEDYVEWVLAQASDGPRHLALYASDAEVFDYRPGRYRTEPPLETASEWSRMADLLEELRGAGVDFTTPGRLARDPDFEPAAEVVLNTARDPIPVKKQPKYNATRWALSGWDDVGINARCFERARELEAGTANPEDWRLLCRAWASDLRTHLTPKRWKAFRRALPTSSSAASMLLEEPALAVARVQRDERTLVVDTGGVTVVLNLRRGLAIDSLAFHDVSDAPLCGTLSHGTFDEIDWAADFYSGHTVLDIPAQARITDLERTAPDVRFREDRIEIVATIDTLLGELKKRISVYADRVELAYGLASWSERPPGSLRTGIVTLLPGGLDGDLAVTCANGGAPERFAVREECDHGASISPLVSAGTAFGATEGELAIDDGKVELALSWPVWKTAALPLLTSRRVGNGRFVRVAFSLSEIDETHRPGAPLYDFELAIRGRRFAA